MATKLSSYWTDLSSFFRGPCGQRQKNIGGTSANGCDGAGIYHYLFVRMKQAQTSSIQFDSVCHKKTWVVVIV